MKNIFFLSLFLLFNFECCINENPEPKYGVITDNRDGNQYWWIKIGKQVWMGENMAYLPVVSPSSEGSMTSPHYYVYGYQGKSVSEAKNSVNYSKYGVLYNYPASKNVCPVGWHMPYEVEWDELADHLGGRDIAGGKMMAIGMWEDSSGFWHSHDPNPASTNESYFSAFPSGFKSSNGNFYYMGVECMFWSSNHYDSGAYYEQLYILDTWLLSNLQENVNGYSVRCIRD